MSDVLERIVADTRRRLESERRDMRTLERDARSVPPRDMTFATAIAGSSSPAHIIAEIKAASPSAGVIAAAPAVGTIASAYSRGGAAAISVVTEPEHFRGDRRWLREAADASGLPVIMKDFIVEEVQLLEGVIAGAGAILLLASQLDAMTIRRFIALLDEWNVDALVEVHDERELERAVEGGARLIGVNNRDLRNFSISLETSERLVSRIPAECMKVSESGIETAEDIRRLQAAGFDAFLVGTSLLRQQDHELAVRRLAGERP